jgi:predicted Zn finger-like uncharacterized protein
VYEPESPGPIRLERRDRFAVVYRVCVTILGAALLAWSILTSVGTGWTIAIFMVVVVGGAIAYHVLTSVTSCPSCDTRMINLAITNSETRPKQKTFRCSRCGTTSYLTEGFFWQADF